MGDFRLPADFVRQFKQLRADVARVTRTLASGRYVTTEDPRLAVEFVRGSINSDGSVRTGTGFSASKTATGKYTVTFDEAFSGEPSVTVSVVSGAARSAQLDGFPDAGNVDVATYTTAGAAADLAFSFIAAGPR